LHEYSSCAVFLLINVYNKGDDYVLDKEITDDFLVISVKTKRQKGNIDLIVIIDVEENKAFKTYVFNLENKWYSTLKNGQLENYKKFIENEFSSNEIINLFITCDNCRGRNYENEKWMCRDNQYKFLIISHIHIIAKMKEGGPTGNALFDEYWFNM
jgi:hypothetical protein